MSRKAVDPHAAWWGCCCVRPSAVAAHGSPARAPRARAPIGLPTADLATSRRSLARPSSTLVQAHLDRCAPGPLAHAAAEGGVHVRYPLPDPPPLVSLIIPTRNGLQLLRQCVQSIFDKTDYCALRDRHCRQRLGRRRTLEYLQSHRYAIRASGCYRDDRPFNFSALNNAAARLCAANCWG